MATNAIEVKGCTLNEIREKVKTQIPANHFILSESIIDDGEIKSIIEEDITVEAAYNKAQDKLEANSEIIEKETVSEPSEKNIVVEAFDEQTAQAQIKRQMHYSDTIKSITLTKKGAKGFLGIGEKPNDYCALVLSPAKIKIRFKRSAKVAFTIGKNKRDEKDNHKLDDFESRNTAFDLNCERCGDHCRALGRPLTNGTVMVMTPELSQRAARFCEKCQIIICGSCAGVSSYSLGFADKRSCPRCGSEPIFAAACHVRATDAKLR